ncbi:hypothetical protein [Luteibaculum oceani]|uniref:Tetratricopeptide repeat protein n=1 Tax=Luteibaculum oceani TaxID=1294296 RepID=A0A5C6VNH8_9FLAO|nr:hypothetical protein [Luteibaculum oceani]TXC85085.1 hypothetical protein FRX97_00235 [Luteibaculum oceani]
MKRILTLFCLFTLVSSAYAGNDLGDKVKEMLTRIDTCASSETIGNILKDYKSMISEHGTDWRSYYWLAYGNLKKAEYSFEKSNRDQAINIALGYVDRARLIKRTHPELDILEALLLFKKIEINRDERENKFIFRYKELMSNAFYLDQLNPRYYYVKGVQALADTSINPQNRKNAIEFFKSAEKLFGPHDRKADDADPTWGFNQTQLFLNVLIPGRTEYFNKDGEKVSTILDVESEMSLKEIEKQIKQEQKEAEKERKRQEKEAKKEIIASKYLKDPEKEKGKEKDKKD